MSDWCTYLDLCVGLAGSVGEVEIKPKSAPVSLSLPLEGKRFEEILDPEYYGYFAGVTNFLEEILRAAGCNDVGAIPFSEIAKNSRMIRLVYALLHTVGNESGALKFSTELPKSTEDIRSPITIAYVMTFTIGAASIGFAAKAEMETLQSGDLLEWSSTRISSFDLRGLNVSADAFQSYANKVKMEMGAMGLVTHTLE